MVDTYNFDRRRTDAGRVVRRCGLSVIGGDEHAAPPVSRANHFQNGKSCPAASPLRAASTARILTAMSDEREDYGDTLEAQILADYVTGGMTMIDACAALGIPLRTNYDRLKANPKFAALMDDARAAGFDAIANGIRKVTRGEEGHSSGDVKRDRLIAEMDAKLLAKWHPKKYGEKLEIEQKTANVSIPVGDDPVAAARAYEQLLKG